MKMKNMLKKKKIKKDLSFNKLEYLTKYFNDKNKFTNKKNKFTNIYKLKNDECKIANINKNCQYDIKKCYEISSFYFTEQKKYLCWKHSYMVTNSM